MEEDINMICNQRRQLQYLLIVSIFFVLLPLIAMGADKNLRYNDVSITVSVGNQCLSKKRIIVNPIKRDLVHTGTKAGT